MIEELNFSRRRRLPVVIGAEAAECGLCSMTMVARYWGHDVDLNGMRQRFSVSLAGASLRSLMELADQLGFSTRAVRLELDELKELKTPAVLHWDLNHFVVLKQVKRNKIVIHDPASGRAEMPMGEVSKHFTGVALEVTPAKAMTKVEAKAPTRIRDLWSGLHGFWGALLHVLLLSVALQIAVFAAPFYLQLVVDEAVFRADHDLLTVLALGFGGLLIVQALITLIRGWTLMALGQMLSFQLVGNLIRHLTRLSSGFFEKRHVGDILSRIGSIGPINDAITRGAIAAIIDGAMSIIAAIILFFYSATLAFVVLAAIALNLIVTLATYPAMRRRMEEEIVASAKEQSHLMETVRASTIVKLMGREVEREASWRNLYADVVNSSFSVGKFQIGLGFAQTIITGLQTIIVIYLAARTILAGDGFSVGMPFAFLSFRQTLTDRLNALIAEFINFRLLSLHLERLSDIVQQEPEAVTELPSTEPPEGSIELKDIAFRYGDGDPFVLDGVDLTIHAGEYVAITGPSGAGKSTLMKLILGLHHPTRGEIFLDGHQASPERWRYWRRHIGVVSQEDRLLTGTLADNISFFDPDMDLARVAAAAEAAQVADDIARMPMQYLSLVGDMGSTLSGGQKQRVLLARALYRQPRLLLLDEGTANLDEPTEQAIADLLESLPITRIVIAHRPALVERASRVLVVHEGRVHPLG